MKQKEEEAISINKMAKNKPRVPVQLSIEGRNRLKDLQRKIRMKTGDNISFRDITDKVFKRQEFEDLALKLFTGDMDMDFNIKFDKRRLI